MLALASAMMLAASARLVAGPFDGTIWAILSEQDQEKILKNLADELEAVRAGRAAQAAADEQAGKTLKQLLDELYTPQTESAWSTYSKKYAALAIKAFQADPAKFAKMAGSASAGDYTALKSELPKIGASVFASLVGDALEAKGMSDTKVVWDALVARAGSLQQIGVSLMRGDTAGALNLAKEQAKGELKSFSENTVAGIINWALSDAGIAPGQAYIQAIGYEKEFIDWSNKTLSNWFIKDCLDTYVNTYNATNQNVDEAVDRYQECSILGGPAFAERNFVLLMMKADLDPAAATRQMLEAYRKNGELPHSWISGLVAAKIAEKNQALAADLAAAQAEVDKSSSLFSKALGSRLAALAQAAMSGKDKAALLAAATKALEDSKADADAVSRASAGAVAACGAFNGAKANAQRILDEMQKLGSLALDLRITARSVPDCGGASSTISADLAEAQRLRSVFDAALADAQAGLQAACTAREGIDTAADQPAALQLVQAARDGAAQASKAIEAGKQAHGGFTPILQRVAATSGQSPNGINMDVVRQYLAELDAKLAQLKAVDGTALAADFAAAKATMNGAQRRAVNLTNYAEQRAELVRTALEPHKVGPLGAKVKEVLEGLDTALKPATSCVYGVNNDWKGSRGWSGKTPNDLPDLAGLEALVTQARNRCPQAAGGAQGLAPEQEIAEIYKEVDAGAVLLDIAKRGYERCLAEALVAYSEAWGTTGRPPVTLRESILIVFDASGSMNDHDRIEKARASATAVLKGVPAGGDVEVALMVFYDCGNIRLEVPFTTDPNEIIDLLPNIRPSGSTPLAAATAKGKGYLRSEARGARKRFILLTDGEESCGGNPVAAIRR